VLDPLFRAMSTSNRIVLSRAFAGTGTPIWTISPHIVRLSQLGDKKFEIGKASGG